MKLDDELEYSKYLGVTREKIQNAKKMEEHKFIDEKERSYFNSLKYSIIKNSKIESQDV